MNNPTCKHRTDCRWRCVINCSEYIEDSDVVRNIGLSRGNREDWLSIKEVATLYGEVVHYKWLSPYGDEWLDKCGFVDGNFIREMEQRSIKDVYILM